MKLFSFPVSSLEKAINKRILTLSAEHKDWFVSRWQQKPYKKSFLDNKVMPLVIFLAKGKSWTDEEFNHELVSWDVKFFPTEVEVLRPLIEGDSLIQLMQKRLPQERIEALRSKLCDNPA